jgi:tetratricopeptide (TPR) repeat protein
MAQAAYAKQPVLQGMYEDAARQYNAGRLVEAEQRFRNILAIQPRHAESLNLLGFIAYRGGRYGAASEFFSDAIRFRKDDPAYHFNLGNTLVALGKVAEAVARFRHTLALRPDFAEAHNNLGILLNQQGMRDDAVAHYQRALAIKPNYPDALNNLGIALSVQGRFKDAATCYERAIALNPHYANAHCNLGNVLAEQGRTDEAATFYEQAIAINPGHAEAHNNLGNIRKEQGRFDEAMAQYSQVLTVNPDHAEAHFNRAEIMTFRPGDADLAALETLAARNDLPEHKALHVAFALGKALEDTGDHARAFEYISKGNTLKRRQINYDEALATRIFEGVAEVFNGNLFDRFRGQGDPSAVPIFVVGMPRSGSSLIEQILASHPQIQGAGELPNLELVLDSAFKGGYPACVSEVDGATIRRLGEAYLASLPALAAGKVRLTDKLPSNFVHIGLLRLILPNARIIHTMRDPIDTCVSCYSKLFTTGLNFSYDLGELGRRYLHYDALMKHWKSVLPTDTILDVSYEEVVNDIEGQARRLIDYCGLPWDDRCVSFHQNSRTVKTASAVQVRKPLFRSSMQRWRKHEASLGPLLNELSLITPAATPLRKRAVHG